MLCRAWGTSDMPPHRLAPQLLDWPGGPIPPPLSFSRCPAARTQENRGVDRRDLRDLARDCGSLSPGSAFKSNGRPARGTGKLSAE